VIAVDLSETALSISIWQGGLAFLAPLFTHVARLESVGQSANGSPFYQERHTAQNWAARVVIKKVGGF